MGIEPWIKLLYTYGPFALLVFFIFIVERKAYNAWKDAPSANRLLLCVYLLNWGAIFGLLGFSIYAWTQSNLTTESVIRGEFENLENSETLTSRSGALFLNRKYRPGGRFDYEWRLVTSKQFADDTKVKFTFDRSTCNTENLNDYELSIKASYYTDAVQIEYDRSRDKLLVKHKGQVQELRPIVSPVTSPAPDSTSMFINSAYARDVSPYSRIATRLESSDSIIRREARSDLAKQGRAALAWIEQVLANPDSSFRHRVGVIAALTQMPGIRLEHLKPATVRHIIRETGDRDRTMRVVARGLIVKSASWDLEKELQQEIESLKQSRSTEDRRITSELARTKLELLYNLGVMEKDKYGSKRSEDRERIGKAITAFEHAWQARSLAAEDDRFVFVKALYGWGHALHDQSWIETSVDRQRKPELVLLAVQKFKEFLNPGRGLGKWKKDEYTEYPTHSERARKYVHNPVPENLN